MPGAEKKARVFLGSLSEADYFALIRKGLEYIEFGQIIPRGARVFIKPNLTFPTYQPGVMTSREALEAAILAVREYTPHIYLGDSDSGGYNRFSMDEVYRATGLAEFAGKYGVQVVNLSKVPTKTISFQYKHREFSLALPRLLTDEIDLLITMPVPKIHCNTGVSLSLKNQWGCIPDPQDRLRLHPYFQHVVQEVNQAVRALVAVVDGRYGLNGNGPLRGRPVELNCVLVADDLGAAERLACELMQIPLDSIRHLRYARKLGRIPELGDIELNRPLEPFLREKFVLKREWTDYPGVFAFNSSWLAYLAYFSPLADALHRILYLFREPFYDYARRSRRP